MDTPKTTAAPYCLLLVLALLFTSSTGDDSDPQLYHMCSSAVASTSSNASKLLLTLSSKAASTGFATASSKDAPVYGLALCRGDLMASPSDCKSCLSGAATALVDLCSKSRAGIVWYDYCLLKYSDTGFFGRVVYDNNFYLYNVMNISSRPGLFTKKVREMLTGLAKDAAEAQGMYAAAQEKLDTFTTLYGMVQCTRDLAADDCRRCLDEAVSELQSCCDGKQGGRVVGGSCYFRYEIYPFLKSSDPLPN